MVFDLLTLFLRRPSRQSEASLKISKPECRVMKMNIMRVEGSSWENAPLWPFKNEAVRMHAFTYTNWSKLVKMVTNLLEQQVHWNSSFFPLCELCGPSGALNGTAQTHATTTVDDCTHLAVANVLKKDTRNWLLVYCPRCNSSKI